MKKAYVTRLVPQKALDMLEIECQMTVNPYDRVLQKEELVSAAYDAEGLLCLLTDQIDADLLDKLSRLKVVANCAVGYDNIDIPACTARGVAVSNTPGVLTETTADMAWALLMAAARRVVEADRYVRDGKFKAWAPMLLLGQEINHRVLGVIGMGRIGKAVARRAAGFRMTVFYHDAYKMTREEEQALGVEYKEMKDLLREADFISLHVPLNEQTRHLIAAQELKLMKKTAYLINTSRGPVIDEKALVKALQDGELAGAALDVYEEEPSLAPGLAELQNVTLAPHTASATVDTRTRMAVMAAENLLAGLKGKRMPNLVNPEVKLKS